MKRILPIVLGGTVTAILGILLGRTYIVPALSPRPENLGVRGGKLAACLNTPNCVSSQATSGYAAMQPIPYVTDLDIARSRLISILRQIDGMTIIDLSRRNYIYAEARSRLWQFVDDVEFYFDDENKLIQFRSSARLGQGDMGVNRERMQAISQQFQHR
jgi:uncharacterized protein (DUF1499 family)